jgi:hypothetical protein
MVLKERIRIPRYFSYYGLALNINILGFGGLVTGEENLIIIF